MNKRILILYTAIGQGHKYIALNMAYHLEHAGYEVKLYDALELQKGLLSEWGEWLHGLINRQFPFIWRWLYMSQTFTDLTVGSRIKLARNNRANLKKEIDDFQPDAIISTQTTPSAMVVSLKQDKLFNGKFTIGFSDYHLHRYWLYDQADLYLVNIPEQAAEMKQLGVKQPIVVCGITMKPVALPDSAEVKSRLNISPDKKVVLVSSGSMGIGFPQSLLIKFIDELAKAQPGVHVIVVCGKSEKLKQDLDREQFVNATILGLHQPMSEIYSVSDLFLTKPGGLTTAECLQAGLPMQITHWLPGQEELNYEYLTSHRLVYPVPPVLSVESLINTLKQRLNNPHQVGQGPAADLITQKNHEGEVLLNTVEKLFHGAFDEPEGMG